MDSIVFSLKSGTCSCFIMDRRLSDENTSGNIFYEFPSESQGTDPLFDGITYDALPNFVSFEDDDFCRNDTCLEDSDITVNHTEIQNRGMKKETNTSPSGGAKENVQVNSIGVMAGVPIDQFDISSVSNNHRSGCLSPLLSNADTDLKVIDGDISMFEVGFHKTPDEDTTFSGDGESFITDLLYVNASFNDDSLYGNNVAEERGPSIAPDVCDSWCVINASCRSESDVGLIRVHMDDTMGKMSKILNKYQKESPLPGVAGNKEHGHDDEHAFYKDMGTPDSGSRDIKPISLNKTKDEPSPKSPHQLSETIGDISHCEHVEETLVSDDASATDDDCVKRSREEKTLKDRTPSKYIHVEQGDLDDLRNQLHMLKSFLEKPEMPEPIGN